MRDLRQAGGDLGVRFPGKIALLIPPQHDKLKDSVPRVRGTRSEAEETAPHEAEVGYIVSCCFVSHVAPFLFCIGLLFPRILRLVRLVAACTRSLFAFCDIFCRCVHGTSSGQTSNVMSLMASAIDPHEATAVVYIATVTVRP